MTIDRTKSKLYYLLLAIALTACTEDEPERWTGAAEAKKNDVPWGSPIEVIKNQYDPGLNILFELIHSDVLSENLFIFRIQPNLDFQKIYLTDSHKRTDTTGVFYSTVWNGDVLNDVYELTSTTEPENFNPDHQN